MAELEIHDERRGLILGVSNALGGAETRLRSAAGEDADLRPAAEAELDRMLGEALAFAVEIGGPAGIALAVEVGRRHRRGRPRWLAVVDGCKCDPFDAAAGPPYGDLLVEVEDGGAARRFHEYHGALVEVRRAGDRPAEGRLYPRLSPEWLRRAVVDYPAPPDWTAPAEGGG